MHSVRRIISGLRNHNSRTRTIVLDKFQLQRSLCMRHKELLIASMSLQHWSSYLGLYAGCPSVLQHQQRVSCTTKTPCSKFSNVLVCRWYTRRSDFKSPLQPTVVNKALIVSSLASSSTNARLMTTSVKHPTSCLSGRSSLGCLLSAHPKLVLKDHQHMSG